jgi:hypothetical protein
VVQVVLAGAETVVLGRCSLEGRVTLGEKRPLIEAVEVAGVVALTERLECSLDQEDKEAMGEEA